MMMSGKGGGQLNLDEEGRSTKPSLPSTACSSSAPNTDDSAAPRVPPCCPRRRPKGRQEGADEDACEGVGAEAAAAAAAAAFSYRGKDEEEEPSVVTGYTMTTNDESLASRSRAHPQEQQHRHAAGVSEAALQAFGDAMDLIDPVEKAGWELARATCPSCVLEHECCPCYFMAACEGNPWDAAARMCSYWKERINLFEDRAFEALTLGSDVAAPTGLTSDDVRLLEKGTLSVLPCDREGRTVIFCDFARLHFGVVDDIKSRLRVLWYVLQAAYTIGEAQCHRMVILFACYTPPLSGGYNASVWQFGSESRVIPAALPITLDSLHLLTLSSRTGTNETLIKFMLAATIEMAGSYVSSFMRMHHGSANKGTTDPAQADLEAKQNLVHQLRDLGFTKKGLPDWAGGLFTLDDFYVWMRRRRRIEQRLFWTAEQRAQQKRAVNRIHSREKRMRRQNELEVLKAQVDDIQSKNQLAKIVHDRLQQLLVEANKVVDAWSNGCPTDEVHDPLPLASPGWTFEPIPELGAAVESLPPELHPALEPDPIAPFYHLPPEVKPDIPSSLPSWTNASAANLDESRAAIGVAHLSYQLLPHGDVTGETQLQHKRNPGNPPMSPNPLGELLTNSSALRALPLQPHVADLPNRLDAIWEAPAYQDLPGSGLDGRVIAPQLLQEASSQAFVIRTSADPSGPPPFHQEMSNSVIHDALHLRHTDGIEATNSFLQDDTLDVNSTDLRRAVTLASPQNTVIRLNQPINHCQLPHTSKRQRAALFYPNECEYF